MAPGTSQPSRRDSSHSPHADSSLRAPASVPRAPFTARVPWFGSGRKPTRGWSSWAERGERRASGRAVSRTVLGEGNIPQPQRSEITQPCEVGQGRRSWCPDLFLPLGSLPSQQRHRLFTWSRRSTNLRLSTLKKKHNNKQKNTKQQVGRPKVPLHGEKRWFLVRRWSQPCLFPSRTASCFPPSFATPADTPSLVGLRSAASQEGHKQSNSEPLLIKLLPNPVTRKAQPWHVSLHRDLAREPPQPPAAQQL